MQVEENQPIELVKSTPDVDDDVSILENIDAASQDDPKPDQDLPFAHIPDDEIMGVDSLVVGLPQVEESAGKIPELTTALERIKSTNRICALEAEAIAAVLPTIMGTKEEPIAYTTVKSQVGTADAIKAIVEGRSALAKDAQTKMDDIIEKALKFSADEVKKMSASYLELSSQFNTARQAFYEATGGYPESSTTFFIKDEPLGEALFAASKVGIKADTLSQNSPIIGEFIDNLKKFSGVGAGNFDNVFGACHRGPFIRVGDHRTGVFLKHLINGEVCFSEIDQLPGISLHNAMMLPLLEPMQTGEDKGVGFAGVMNAIEAMVYRLKEDADDLSSELTDDEVAKLINKLGVQVTILNELVRVGKIALRVTEESIKVLMQLLNSGDTPVQVTPSTEKFADEQPRGRRRMLNLLG